MQKPDLLSLQLELRDARRPHALATVIEILGSSSAKPGAKVLIGETGEVLAGWIGGGCAQAMAVDTALKALASGEPCVIDVDLTDEVFGAGMPCGGSMRVYVEPVVPKPRAWLLGHGRIVEALCEFAGRLGFDAIVDDHQALPTRFPGACRLITDDQRYQQLQPFAGDFVVVATHHKGDYDALTQALNSEAGYIALVSSRKRAQLVISRLAGEGWDETSLKRIRAPAGLDLGAKTPEEIALAIVAEMVAVRRGAGCVPLSGLPASPPG